MLLRFLPLVQLVASTTAVVATLEFKDCFSADGAPVSDNFPCDPTANVSSCCGPSWVCATNLYCRSRVDPAAKFVGTCTDRTWKDPACPFIQDTKSVFPYNYFNYTLNTTLCNDMTICPSAGNTTCCDAGEGIHEIIFREQQETPTDAASLSEHYASEGYSLSIASSTTSAVTSATTSADTSASTSASGTSPFPTTSSGSHTSSTSAIKSSATPTSTNRSDSGEQLGKSTQIVLATVLPALALLVGAGTWWETARRNRTRKAANTAANRIPPHTHPLNTAANRTPSRIHPPMRQQHTQSNRNQPPSTPE